MNLVAAKCPDCGAGLNLDSSQKEAFCMYCGSQILIQEAVSLVRIDNSENIKNYIKIADSSYELGNYQSAFDYYSKVLEDDFNNWYAIYRRGLCNARQSNLTNPKCRELLTTVSQALEMLPKTKMTQKEIFATKADIAKEVCSFAIAFQNLAQNHFFEYINLSNSGEEFFDRTELAIDMLDFAMDLMNIKSMGQTKMFNLAQDAINSAIMMCDAILQEYQYRPTPNDIRYHRATAHQKSKTHELKSKFEDKIAKYRDIYWDRNPKEKEKYLAERLKQQRENVMNVISGILVIIGIFVFLMLLFYLD